MSETTALVSIDLDNLSYVKDKVIEACKLGMSLKKAFIYAQCSKGQQDLLQKNETFMERVEYTYSMLEAALLTAHNYAMAVQIKAGVTSGVQWKLSRINRERWGDKLEIEDKSSNVISFAPEDEGLL